MRLSVTLLEDAKPLTVDAMQTPFVEPIVEILNKLQQLQQQTSTIRSWLLS